MGAMRSSVIIIKGERKEEVCGKIPKKEDKRIVYNGPLEPLPFNPFYCMKQDAKKHLKRLFGKGWYQVIVYDGALGPRRPLGKSGMRVI
ncbi:MAG: hypothetical protein ACTSUW_05410 [Candidatus Heimdallarchaeota archaeon]